ncbi:MAG: glycosyltransferase family 2 protein [Candidatus Dormibacteraeota bacterium]|uniref:Glycosyl transferase family 2 n=1 Tax=Candidatus Aeolococcus gillhamiae TaxID=3127015 RepID=A0A2W5Z508_9BACT|nr:glycosyltransferase family 2 protein [Candidatus Dormibacteraeota bacterium]PZR80419.1 MAG: glycosyl transferase family 2 [Candidatus Dormibacter sp. RRmetagenome_bin12]
MEPHGPKQPYPFVSVVVPVYNEERYIEACLTSVLDQDFPPDRYEVIVADGGSSDSTRDLVEELARQHPNLRLIDNPGRTQAAGLNCAILASCGDFIARQDGHAEWTRHHLRRSVELLLESGADNVGGRADGAGRDVMGRAIACAMRSPFGVGGARFRYSQRTEDVPTVFPGTFRRSALERVGLFDEAYPPHEDYELNHRIRASGGRVLFSPDIPTRYHVRDSVTALARQYFRYGRAKVRVARSTLGVIRPYHLAAPALVAALPAAALMAATRRGRPRVVAGAAVYAASCVAAGLRAARAEPAAVRVRVPPVFAVMHLSWGVGFWAGAAEAARGVRTGGGAPPQLPRDHRANTSSAV